jgi:hypothetical protein
MLWIGRTGDGLEEILLDDDALDEVNRSESASADADLFDFKPLASEANFDRVLYDGGEFGFAADVGSLEELDFIGIPGLLEPEQVQRTPAGTGRRRQSRRVGGGASAVAEERGMPSTEEPPAAVPQRSKSSASLLNSAGRHARAKRTGEPHAHHPRRAAPPGRRPRRAAGERVAAAGANRPAAARCHAHVARAAGEKLRSGEAVVGRDIRLGDVRGDGLGHAAVAEFIHGPEEGRDRIEDRIGLAIAR